METTVSELHPLLQEVIKISQNKIEPTTDYTTGDIFKDFLYIDHFHPDHLGYNGFYLKIKDDKLIIKHCSNNCGESVYTTDAEGNDFTPKTALDAIQKTMIAIKQADKILGSVPLQNF